MRERQIRIAIISDALTHDALEQEATVIPVTPLDARLRLAFQRPDFLFVESAWQGRRDRWKYRVASYADHPKRSNRALARVVAIARDKGIPTVFWNKEDGVHYERFIESAKLFDHVFTVDENCLPRYRADLPAGTTIGTLMFATQPSLHGFEGIAPKIMRANFVGSYSHHVHEKRRELQNMLFAAAASELGLTVYDRNSGRRAEHYRYPKELPIEVRPAVRYAETARVYRDFLVSLNVNTVQDSPTMFSRRLIEIIACGGLAVTTPAVSVDRLFASYCHVVHTGGEARELFARLRRDGLSARERDMMRAGAEHVAQHHTWAHRLREIYEVLGLVP